MASLFSAFIFSCGVTHLMHLWTTWQPDHAVQALTKIVTAALSMVTAITELEAEVGRRCSAEDQLAAIQQSLAVTLTSIEADFIATDRSGRVTHMNAVAETITARTQHDAIGLELWTVFEREGRPLDYLSRNPADVMMELGISVETAHRVVAISRTGARTPLELKAALDAQ